MAAARIQAILARAATTAVVFRRGSANKTGFISGENVCVDGGMTRQMIYHNDFGWTLSRA